MKRYFLAFIVVLLMSFTACTAVPESAYDLVCDLSQCNSLDEFFEQKTADEWAAMGEYSLLLKGLPAPAVLAMSGMDVLSVSAYGHSQDLGTDGGVFQDATPVSVASAEDTIVVNLSWDYNGKTFLFTKEACYELLPKQAISTQVFVNENGTLAYHRYWGEYVTTFQQYDYAPLDLCTAKDHFLEEFGRAEITNGEVVLTPEKTVTVSDICDLEALFSEAKAAHMYEEYTTLEALLAANKAKATLS